MGDSAAMCVGTCFGLAFYQRRICASPELVRLHDEVRNTRLATRDMRRSLADQEARNREAREGHDRQLREAEGALRSDEAVQELLRLPNEQMHALAALMDPAPPSPRAAPQANPSPAKVDTNRTTMKWLLQDRRPESAGTKERKRLAARADVAFEDLGTRTGIHDPEELGEYIVEKARGAGRAGGSGGLRVGCLMQPQFLPT